MSPDLRGFEEPDPLVGEALALAVGLMGVLLRLAASPRAGNRSAAGRVRFDLRQVRSIDLPRPAPGSASGTVWKPNRPPGNQSSAPPVRLNTRPDEHPDTPRPAPDSAAGEVWKQCSCARCLERWVFGDGGTTP
jgi:hypothetical protein